MTLQEETLAVAITQVGVEEIPRGSNAGPEVEEYLKAVGLPAGYSWCMAFVYWSCVQAAKKLNTIVPILRTAGVLRLWNESVMQRIKEPTVGCIFILDYGNGKGHTGLVERFDKTYIYTVEGNTNDKGSREGYMVARRKRLRKTVKGYVAIA